MFKESCGESDGLILWK